MSAKLLATPMSKFASTIMSNKYAHDTNGGNKESWEDIARRQAVCVVRPYLPELEARIESAIASRKFMPGGRYLYAAGRRYPQISNCLLFRAEDCREGWGRLMYNVTQALMTGGGVGVVYSPLRPEDSVIAGMGGKSTGPCALMNMVNESGRFIKQGGSRRSAIWAGMHWWHPDVFRFIALKQWSELIHGCRREDFNFPAPMDGTNISVILDDDFFEAMQAVADGCPWWKTYNEPWGTFTVNHDWVDKVWRSVTKSQMEDGEPGWSVNVGSKRESCLRNACTEIDSADDCDNCNLGSINMARVENKEQFAELVEISTAFLLCGSLYGVLPVPEMVKVRERNRRIGVGLMGIHEWLLKRGHRYGPCDELAEWMRIYEQSTKYAYHYANRLGIANPVATRSIAPTGTISIVAETTSGIEPVFAVAYKRRYLDGKTWKAQHVIDATAKRLIDSAGLDPAAVEDAYTLAEDPARRIGFQSWMQQFVDHGISSTINLPEWGSSINNESTVDHLGKTIMSYLPSVRGLTVYPNGSRGGQPLNRMTYHEAIRQGVGREFVEEQETPDQSCANGFCNS